MDQDILSWIMPLSVTFSVAIPLLADWREARHCNRQRMQHADARRRHVRQVYPVLSETPLPPFKGAPAIPKQLPLDTRLFSDQTALMTCEVMLDGDCVQGVFTMKLGDEWGRVPNTLQQLEDIARVHAHQEWLVQFTAPLQSLVYQRHGDGEWNLVRTGPGIF